MRKLHSIRVSIILIVLSCYACNDFEDVAPQSNVKGMNNQITPTKLGKKIENYYSVKNMQKALDSMRTVTDKRFPNAVRVLNNIQITTTDWYIRFLPADSTQYDALMSDTTMMLYEYPLDYEVQHIGDGYIDPSIGAGKPQWLYTVVKPDKSLPNNILHEVLSELFIPEHAQGYDDAESDTFGTLSNVLARLEMVSRYMTGNFTKEELKQIQQAETPATSNPQARKITPPKDDQIALSFWSWLLGSKWTPSGSVKVWDENTGRYTTVSKRVFSHWETEECDFEEEGGYCDVAIYKTVYETKKGSYVPIRGVKVRARKFLKLRKGTTDSQGNFKVNGSFRSKARYKIYWERYQFTIREEKNTLIFFGNTADLVGPNQKSPWHASINKGNVDWFHAMIFRAAYHYCYEDIKGLRRPPRNGTWKTQMKLAAMYSKRGSSTHSSFRRFLGFGSSIHISGKYRESSIKLYGTTLHEIAHAAHWDMDASNYNVMNDCPGGFIPLYCSGDREVAESWARGVQWALGRMVYKNYEGGSRNQKDGYTHIVADMIDNGITDHTNKGKDASDGDEVSGYTIRQLEDALKGTKKWNEWRDNIKNMYENDTEDKLDKLFKSWER